MNKRERMNARIEAHGEILKALFGLKEKPVDVAKRFRRWERQLHSLAEKWCNGDIGDDEATDSSQCIMNKVFRYIGEWRGVVFFNGDPRGYALKLDDNFVRQNEISIARDWGGYGILAPDLSQEG